MYERLINIIKSVGRPKVLLVGDFMLDHYVYGDIDRISPEAPVMVLNVRQRQEQPGGSGSVATALAALEAEVACVGVVGADTVGERLKHLLGEVPQIQIEGLSTVSDRPTTLKQRVIGLAQHRHRQQLIRIDEENSEPIEEAIRQKILAMLPKWLDWCDVVCLEDYDKGVLCNGFCQQLIGQAREGGKKVIVDPAAIGDYERYRGAWLIKPNRRELTMASGQPLEESGQWQAAAAQLAEDFQIDHVVLTLDKEGAFLYQRESGLAEPVPTQARSVYDVTGAGDMVLALLGLLIGGDCRGIEPPRLGEVVYLANVAGGLEVERFGSVGLSRQEIMEELSRQRRVKSGKLRNVEGLLQDLRWHRQQALKVVFTNGCFDILHPGHIHLLSFAKEQGDILVVAINSDRSVRSLKGPSRPILKQQDRAALLSALEVVDYVIIFDELDPLGLIRQISPDVLVKGSDWTGAVVGQEWVEAHGGKVVLMPLVEGRSTTNIINQVIERHGNGSVNSAPPKNNPA